VQSSARGALGSAGGGLIGWRRERVECARLLRGLGWAEGSLYEIMRPPFSCDHQPLQLSFARPHRRSRVHTGIETTAVGGDEEEWKSGRRSGQEWAYLDIEGTPDSFRALQLVMNLSSRREEEEGGGKTARAGEPVVQRVSW
jgi:hypothetical protein